MIDFSEAMGETGTFKKLSDEELKKATTSAEEALSRQRQGIETPGPVMNGEKVETLLGPKDGPITKGVSWGEEKLNGRKAKGLVSHEEGYYYACEYDTCVIEWSTEILPREQISVLVKMYEMHVSQYHDRKNSSSEQVDKDEEVYEEVTKLKVIEAHEDNRMDVLSYVRFLPMPLQYQQIAAKQPAKQSPVWARIDLSHLGVHLADSSIIVKLHDRHYSGAQLKYFSNTNLGMNENDKDLMLKPSMNGMKTTRNIREISSIYEAVNALLNFQEIWRHIHPMDWGSPAIVRFLLDRINHPIVGRRLTNVMAICKFFQSAFKGNADRVMGPDGPRTYPDLVSFYNSLDWNNAGTSEVTYSPKKTGVKRPNSDGSRKGMKEARTEIQVCWAFNGSGCNSSDGDACQKRGKSFKHICSFRKNDGSICGANDHGKQGHED